jgi:hypothetical protein
VVEASIDRLGVILENFSDPQGVRAVID